MKGTEMVRTGVAAERQLGTGPLTVRTAVTEWVVEFEGGL
jgi:hypothetical protein